MQNLAIGLLLGRRRKLSSGVAIKNAIIGNAVGGGSSGMGLFTTELLNRRAQSSAPPAQTPNDGPDKPRPKPNPFGRRPPAGNDATSVSCEIPQEQHLRNAVESLQELEEQLAKLDEEIESASTGFDEARQKAAGGKVTQPQIQELTAAAERLAERIARRKAVEARRRDAQARLDAWAEKNL